ncbi:MAG: uracil-DNA glycosylase [Bacteroidota bacterium]
MNSEPQFFKPSDLGLEPGWRTVLQDEFNLPYMLQLKSFLIEERANVQTVYPPGPMVFRAFNSTPWDKVRVVILGQDPYHGPGQAHGLCFSVPKGIPHPPSLRNVFKELNSDCGIPIPQSGDLSSWAEQGVLLLNATLSVRDGQAGSHQNMGWEIFTDSVIKKLSSSKKGLVFILWGRYARNKAAIVDNSMHHILECVHPSPLSAHAGFFGCKHFSLTNSFLVNDGSSPIDWSLND